jgi:hypothetical protein
MPIAALAKLSYPIFGSVKLDGIRGVTTGTTKVHSNSGHALPNRRLWQLAQALPPGLDCELTLGDPTSPGCYTRTMSAVMSHDGLLDDLTLNVFDYVPIPESGLEWSSTYTDRLDKLSELYMNYGLDYNAARIILLPQVTLWSPEQVMEYYEASIALGYEGICGRSPTARYKFGRSGKTDQILWRIKQEDDAECEILDVLPLEINNNDTHFTPHGYKTRSSHQENQIAIDSVGSFLCRDLITKVIFSVGIFKGVTSDERDQWWDIRESLKGRIFTYRSHVYGVKDKPRSARFIRWRSALDMS